MPPKPPGPMARKPKPDHIDAERAAILLPGRRDVLGRPRICESLASRAGRRLVIARASDPRCPEDREDRSRVVNSVGNLVAVDRTEDEPRTVTTSLPRHFGRNALSNYAGAGVSLILALGLTPIMVRGLGAEGYGVWVLATSAIQYFSLLHLGFGGATIRYIAVENERRDTHRLRSVVATSALSLMVPGAFLLLISPGLALLFPRIFDVPHDLVVPGMVVALLTTIDLAFSLPTDVFGTTLIGLQRYDLLNLTVAGTSIAQAVGWIVVIALGGGLIPLGICLLGFSLLGQLSRYLFARRLLGTNVLKRRYFDRKLVRTLLSMSGWLAVHEVAITVIGQIDSIVVGIVVGVPEAGIYAVGLKLASLTKSLTDAVQAIFYPEASRLAAAGDHDGLRRAVFTGTRMSMAVAVPINVILAVLAKPALDAWVGPGFSSAALVVVYLSGAVVVTSIAGTLVNVLNGMGNVKVPAFFAVVEAGMNFPLSIALGLTIGLQGVALATLIAAVIANLGLTVPYSCRATQISMAGLISVVVRAHLPPSIAAIGVGLLLSHGGLSGLLQVAAAGAAMLVTYAMVLFVTGLSAAERSLVVDMVLPGRAH